MNVLSKKAGRKPFELMLDQERIARRIRELGQQITTDYKDRPPVLIGVLKGCIVFLADLIRAIDLPLEVDFVAAASYREREVPDEHLELDSSVSIALKGRHVLIVEGIVDSGRTVRAISDDLQKLEPASIEVVSLIDKPASHRWKLTIKYKGFTVGNEFVIGYGLDNAQKYRNLPFIGRMIEQ